MPRAALATRLPFVTTVSLALGCNSFGSFATAETPVPIDPPTGDAHTEHTEQGGPPDDDPHAHHGGHHAFEDAERWAEIFDDPARDSWQNPDAVIAVLELEPNAVVADIGSGTGYFSVRIARALPRGHVYAIDVSDDMVRYVNERAAEAGLENVTSRIASVDDPFLPEAVDLVLLVNTYHHITDRTDYFARIAPKLAPGGRLAIVDFKPGELPVGPPPAMKIATDAIVEELSAAGYRLRTDERHLLPYQDVLVFDGPDPGTD